MVCPYTAALNSHTTFQLSLYLAKGAPPAERVRATGVPLCHPNDRKEGGGLPNNQHKWRTRALALLLAPVTISKDR
jgi:hypothetical protein